MSSQHKYQNPLGRRLKQKKPLRFKRDRTPATPPSEFGRHRNPLKPQDPEAEHAWNVARLTSDTNRNAAQKWGVWHNGQWHPGVRTA